MLRSGIVASVAVGLLLATEVLSASRATRAEWPASFETAWGTLRADAAKTRYAGAVETRPADGRIAFPLDFPPIVACTTGDRTFGPESFLSLTFDPESGAASALLPAPTGKPKEFLEALVAERVTQVADGTVLFPASAARTIGPTPGAAATAKLESNGAHHRIGFWTDAADSVVWDYDATRWGRYRVLLTYSTASPDGGVATVELGGETLDVELPTTRSWYDYRTIEVGTLYLATAGKHELTVRAKKLSGAALMNLKAALLVPTFESHERATQAEDGTITLHARDAWVHGTKLRYEPKPEKNTLGFWTEVGDSAHWEFRLQKPGEFDVEVWQGCGTGQGGSKMLVIASEPNRVLPFEVEETGHFQNFVPRIVGSVRFDEAGPHYLGVQPTTIAKAAACDIRQIRLIPVAPAKP